MLHYSVVATFEDPAQVSGYLAWLVDEGHVAEVCQLSGARAEVVALDCGRRVESRYVFPSSQAFADYERAHAPRLRAEGRARFPEGVVFERRVGQIQAQITP